jgi:hypothetical protein
MCVDFLFRSSKYVVVNLLCGCSEIFNWESFQVFATTQKQICRERFYVLTNNPKMFFVVVVVDLLLCTLTCDLGCVP